MTGTPTKVEAPVLYSLIFTIGVSSFRQNILPSLQQVKISFDFCDAFVHLLFAAAKDSADPTTRNALTDFVNVLF